MLEVVLPAFVGGGRGHGALPFAGELPGFLEYLEGERGLRLASIAGYRHHLSRVEAYLARIGVRRLSELSPAILSAFIAERSGSGLAKVSLCECCAVLRVFLRYAHREEVIASDLSGAIDGPQVYRLSSIPRSISWEEVGRVLAGVDRRTPCGKRDGAILMLLVTYGLRSREVAALTLDDINWRRERLACRSARPGTRPRSGCRRRLGRRWWTICATGARRARSGACSSARSRRCWAKLKSGMVAQFNVGIGGLGTKEEVTPAGCAGRTAKALQ
jgi:integrase/recombinase XerD